MDAKITLTYRFDVSNGSSCSAERMVMSLEDTKIFLDRMKGVLETLAEAPSPSVAE